MNRELLLQHFDRISEAPDAIPRLRRFILDLAVRGKLVEQDPGAEPAAELLKRFDLIGSETQSNWVTAKIGQLMSFQYGKAFPAINRNDQGSVAVFGSNGIVGYCETALTMEPAIIIGRKGSAGALNLCDGPSWTTDVAYFLIPPDFFNIRFLYVALQSLDLGNLGKGVKPGLSRSEAYQLSITVPPLAEQQRIVAKVDELMALCDQLQAARNERETRRDKLVASSLNRISMAAADEAKDAASFHLDHLPRLTTRTEQIKQLRQTILNLAVRGRLVPQDPNDEPAGELLKIVSNERKKLLNKDYLNASEAKSQLRKQAIQSVPGGLERIPAGWQWATLMQCSALVVDCHNKTAPYSQTGIPLIRTTNVRDGKFNLKEPKFVDESTYKRWSARCEPKPGDILITREAPMGEVAIVPDGMKICMGQRMMLSRLIPNTINPQFMLYSLRDPLLMNRVQDKPVGATVQHLRVGGVETLLVPLPPLAEQQRIVAKVDELMALCDQLESQLTTTETDSRRLLEAVLRDALDTGTKEAA